MQGSVIHIAVKATAEIHITKKPFRAIVSKQKISKGASLCFDSCTNCCEVRSAGSLAMQLQGGVPVSSVCSVCNYTEKGVQSIVPLFCFNSLPATRLYGSKRLQLSPYHLTPFLLITALKTGSRDSQLKNLFACAIKSPTSSDLRHL